MLAGRSNVGKSTLLNALVGTKIAIMSSKPQTTRQPVRGVLNEERGQIVFVDTPGIFLGKKDVLSKRLNEYVKQSLEGIDGIVYVVDPTRQGGEEEAYIQKLLRASDVPIFLAVNKSDMPLIMRPFFDEVRMYDVGQKATFEVSAMTRTNLNHLLDALFEALPEGEPFYPDTQQITDLTHKQWLEELIREKAFDNLGQELPYLIHVELHELEKRDNGSLFIQGTIYTTEENHKGMIIGRKGQKLKEIGSAARKELETATGSKVYLDLNVKVDPKWRERFR